MAIDDLIDRLVSAIAARGVPPPTPPDDAAMIAEIEGAIAPLRLPVDLRRLHERIDVETLRLTVYPGLLTPERALRSWQQDRWMPGRFPTALFPVCYESWSFVSIELDGAEDREGGAMVYWAYDDETFDITHLSLRDWLAGWVAAAEAPTSGRVEQPNGPRLRIEGYDIAQVWSRSLLAGSPHPVYGTAVEHRTAFRVPAFMFPMRLWEWPERWRRLGGIDDDQALPRGVTSTIADLLRAVRAADGEVVMATIAGEVAVRSGSGEGSVLRVRDATGELTVWCPRAASLYFDGGGGAEWELDVGMRWDDAAQRFEDDRARLATSDDVDDRIRARFLDAGHMAPDMAVAAAIRPLWRYQ